MKTILVACYGVAAAFALLCGWVYPVVEPWSYLAAGALGFHCLLSLIVAVSRMMDGGKIAAWCWQGLSALGVSGLLLPYVLRKEGGWLLAAVALGSFTLLVTLVFSMALKPDAATRR